MKPAFEALITVNSPGEVATWLAPVAHALAAMEARVSVFVMPCTYASGTEVHVIEKLPGVQRVFSIQESLSFALWGRAPRGFETPARGVLLRLGGEFFLAARLAARLRLPAAAYTEGYVNSKGAFQTFFVPRESSAEALKRRGAAADAVRVVGDLMVDAALMRLAREKAAGSEPGDAPTVALLPGSRPHEVRVALPLLVRAAARLAEGAPNLRWVAPVSPFVRADALRAGLDALGVAARSDALEALFSGGADRLELLASVSSRAIPLAFERGDPARAMAEADLALTIPGSNTAELAVYGVPMVVALPLDKAEEIPLDGVAGLVDRLPIVGRRFKAALVRRAAAKMDFVALPNRIAGEMLVPELKAQPVTPEDIHREAAALLADKERRRRISHRLQAAMGPPGAAGIIARTLMRLAEE